MASIAFGLVSQLGLLDVSDELVQVDLIGAACFEELVGFCNAMVALSQTC